MPTPAWDKDMNDEFRRRELRIKTLEEKALGYKKPCPYLIKNIGKNEGVTKSIPEEETPFLKIKPDYVVAIINYANLKRELSQIMLQK